MSTYLGIYAVFSVMGFLIPDRKSFPAFTAIGGFLIWFMGYRYYVGCDYTGYLHRWLITPFEANLRTLMAAPEPAFDGIMILMKSAGFSYNDVLAVYSTIMVVCYVLFARAHRCSLTIIALLFPIIIVQLGMSGLRQAIAGGFLMLASIEFMEKRRIRTAFWVLIGAHFHASVIVFLPMAVLAGQTIYTWRLAAAVGTVFPVVTFFLFDRAAIYNLRYGAGEVVSGGAVIRYALIMIPVVIMPFYRHQLRLQFPKVYPLLKLFVLISFSLAPLTIFSSIALHRVNYYIMPFSIIMFTYLIPVMFSQKDRLTARLIPVAAYGLYSVMWFLMSRHANSCYVPYNNVTFLGS